MPTTALRQLSADLRADHDAMRRQNAQYRSQGSSAAMLPVHLITRIGFQMLAVYRVMRTAHQLRIPLVPQLLSRAIRHLYGAEIHWRTQIDGGVSVVHGTGLVLSQRARVSAGCILFQGVTLGESIDPVTREVGAPLLEAGVHVMPGAVLLGPITVGAGSKVMANVVLDRSVPPNSIVRAPTPEVVARAAKAAPAGAVGDHAAVPDPKDAP